MRMKLSTFESTAGAGRVQAMLATLGSSLSRARILPGLAVAFAVGFVCGTSASAQVADQTACELPFPFPAAAIEARVLMVGDLHATRETPRLAAELTCTLARSGAPVTLAIEMPRDEQPALEVYLDSDGGEMLIVFAHATPAEPAAVATSAQASVQ